MNRFRHLVLIAVRTMSVYYSLMAAASLYTFGAELDSNDKVMVWLLLAGTATILFVANEVVRYLFKSRLRVGWYGILLFAVLQTVAFVCVLIAAALPTTQSSTIGWSVVVLMIPVSILAVTIFALLHPAMVKDVFSRQDVAA